MKSDSSITLKRKTTLMRIKMLISLEDVKYTLLKNIKESFRDDADCANIDEVFVIRNSLGKINLFIFHNNTLSIDIDSIIKRWFSYTFVDKYFNFEEWLDGYYINDYEMDKFYEYARRPENKVIDKIYWYEESYTYDYWKRSKKSKLKLNTKIVTFHSNKSCMGVSTLCTATAIELAKEGKKVIVIDTDFDTHGLTQLFNLKKYDYCNGFLDFLIYPSDELVNYKKDLFYHNFRWEFFIKVSDIDGLFVMPPVKITNDDIDFKLFRCPCMCVVKKKIELLITLIKNRINPDYILFDLRTGINDMGGIISGLSDYHCFVGGEDRQSRVGLKFLIKHVLTVTKKDGVYKSNMFFIHSPQSKLDSTLSNDFDDMVFDSLRDADMDKLDTKYLLKMPYIANFREYMNDHYITEVPSLINNSYKETIHNLIGVLND